MCYIGDIIERDIKRFLLTKQIKKCKKCGIIGKHTKNKTTKINSRRECAACNKKASKEHYKENRDARLAQRKENYEENRDAILAYKKEYREENRDARLAYKKEYHSRPESKQKINARDRRRRATDPALRTRVV